MQGNMSRMVSLFGIVALGVMMRTGLMSFAPSMRIAGQEYYVQQNVFDLRVLSTLGLSEEDIAAIAAVDGVQAVEAVDTCVGRVVAATMKMGGIAMITADHGSAEVMTQPDGSPMTAHTTNPVPFILCGAGTELRKGRLADIAPTILDVMGLAVPEEMDGQTLIVK